MRDDVKEWLLLSAIEGVGATRLKLLIEYFGSPKAVLDASFQQLIAVSKIDEKIAKNITHQRAFKFAEKQIEIIPFIDERYPKNLLKIYDPPAFLYIRGKIKKEDDIAIAIVGSRAPTIYGKTITERLARDLAERGITVVSGMARGIDSEAHKGALKAGGRTIAISREYNWFAGFT